MTEPGTPRFIQSLLIGLLLLGSAGFVLGWGSGLVHILGVLVALLLIYLLVRRPRG